MYQQIFALFFINSLFSLVHHISLFSNTHVYFYLNNLVQKLALYKSSSHYNNICLNSLDFLWGGEEEGKNCLKDREILKKKRKGGKIWFIKIQFLYIWHKNNKWISKVKLDLAIVKCKTALDFSAEKIF